MKTPTTKTPRNAGSPLIPLKTGGVHLALWPCFNKWVKKAERAAAWKTIEDKEKFFVNLAAVCFSGSGAPSAFSYCFQIQRAFSVAALGPLVKRADELSDEHLRDFCYNPSEKSTAAQVSRRQKARKAADAFSQLSTNKRKRKSEVKP